MRAGSVCRGAQSMDDSQHAIFMTQKSGVEKAPKGCKIVRTFEAFDELPGHVKGDKELLALRAEGGDDFQLFGVIFQSIQDNPRPGQPVDYGRSQGPAGNGPYGPKFTEQCNWVAWTKQRGMSSRRSLSHGSGKRMKFGAPPSKSKLSGRKRQR